VGNLSWPPGCGIIRTDDFPNIPSNTLSIGSPMGAAETMVHIIKVRWSVRELQSVRTVNMILETLRFPLGREVLDYGHPHILPPLKPQALVLLRGRDRSFVT